MGVDCLVRGWKIAKDGEEEGVGWRRINQVVGRGTMFCRKGVFLGGNACVEERRVSWGEGLGFTARNKKKLHYKPIWICHFPGWNARLIPSHRRGRIFWSYECKLGFGRLKIQSMILLYTENPVSPWQKNDKEMTKMSSGLKEKMRRSHFTPAI